ncbi:MAG: C4-dicarboxylate ABC transporter permease [Rhodobacteraceae bacterium]|nr:MAG: C4-dicarboxylate ABC transporter permease [Paracoccaceae bacterium]
MAGHSAVLEDGSLLSRLDQKLLKLEVFMALLSGLAVFSIMVLAVISVGGRNLFNAPLPGYVDWIEQVMPLLAFLGIAYVQRDGGHIRMDIVIGRLRGRAMWLAELFSVVLVLLLMIALVYGSWSHFLRSFDFAAPLWSRDSTIDIGLPIWPTKLLVPVSFSVLCLRLVLQIWGYGRAFIRGETRPVAVPLIQDAAAQAAAEADQLDG